MSVTVNVVGQTAVSVSVAASTGASVSVAASTGASVVASGGIGPAGFITVPGTSTQAFGTFQIAPGDGITVSTADGQFLISSYPSTTVSSLAPVQSVAGRTGTVVLQASDVTAGTFAIGRIPTIGYTALSGVPTAFTPASHTHDASAVASGTLSIARIPTISYTALSNTPATFTPSAHTHSTTDVVAFTAAAAAAAPVQSVAGRSGAISLTTADVGGLAAVASSGSYTSLQSIPANFAPQAHTHSTADITGFTGSFAAGNHTHDATAIASGVLDPARIPVIGYTALSGVPSSFAPAAHTHSLADLTQSSATTGQVAAWNGTAWAAATPSPGGVTSVAGRTGTVTLAQLASSGTASATTFLRGDGAWAAAGSTDAGDLVTGTLAAARLPLATTTVAGAVIIGSGLTISSGVLSATGGGGGGGSGEDSLLRSIFVPPAPTGLTASPGNAQVSLSWTAPAGVIVQAPITDYTVEFKTAAAADWGLFSRAASNATNAVVTGLTNGTSYVFRVSAVNIVGSGTPTAVTGAVTPAAVTPDQFFENVAMLLRMDGSGGTFADSSPRPKDIFANGSATQSAAQSKWGGKSALFGGGGGYLSLANYADLNFSTGAFTIECWVRIASFADALTIYAKCQPGNHSLREMAVQIIDANTLRLYHGQRGSTETIRNFTTPTALTTGAWHHVAFTRDDAFLCRAFVDGVASASTHTDIANLDNSFPAFVGAFVLGGDVYGPFLGNIDSLRITKGIARTITLPTAEFPDFGPMSAPTSLAATSGNAQLALTWTAPSYNGGSAITGYTVEYTPSGGSPQTVSTGGTGTSYTLTGLTNGTTYAVRVAAVNAVGTAYSSFVNSTPNPPSAPTAVRNLIAEEQAWGNYAFWSPPASDGGSPITSYRVVIVGNVNNAGTTTQSASQRNKFIEHGSREIFQITIYAVNAIGESPGVTVSGQTGDNS
jgi:hypothetical protein